ncbi:XRE family transcriptional regulator [Paenibacillus qinlingensis]|uniref:Transcriptional regulator with XRE-family HTH domain n=1 Tax=Paenibacillus qinlingensis TaxID=1837343 RepID=A0ABU1NNX2_9BACL|nr:XRE family transcriptional regulator [Paenibacillus qinlingensis]MDR6549103.1 transcriptional regulator with XRE-family HTH domain [Paenibacillus qinlingensis]
MDLGARIKKLRLEQNRSLLDVATISGFSKSLLSKIENGKTVPPIATLVKIADALGTKVSTLLDDEQQTGSIYTSSSVSKSKLVKTDKGYSFFAFAVERGDKMMQPFLFTAKKIDYERGSLYSHVGEEFVYVLEGEMQYKVGNTDYLLKAGDSLYFDSIEKHTLIPISDEVVYLAIFSQSKP